MKTIAIKQIIRDDGSIANIAPENPWPPIGSMRVVSDGTNYTIYEEGDELPPEPPSSTIIPELTLQEKMQKIVDLANELGVEL